MRLPRLAASAIGVAIVSASALAIAAPASAATPGVTYVTAAQVGTGVAPGWNLYQGSPLVSTTSGLSATGSAWLTYGFADSIPAQPGTPLTDLANLSSFVMSDFTGVYTEIAWTDPTGNLHWIETLRPGAGAFSTPGTQWVSSTPINGFESGTLAEFDIAFDDPSQAGSNIIAVGAYAGSPRDFRAYTANGEQFSFMPTPVSSAPTTLTQTEYAATGITITTTGFVPGENVEVYQSFPTANGPDGGNAPGVTADANGAITYTFRPEAGVTPLVGDYNLTFVGEAGAQFFDYAVTASAALAATGTDSLAPLAAGGVLLLGGAALAIVAIRKRRTV